MVMKKPIYTMRGQIWVYPVMPNSSAYLSSKAVEGHGPLSRKATAGHGSWYFVNVSKKASQDIKKKFDLGLRGFGSVPVVATIGKTSWRTSIFSDKKAGAYLLPLKAEVRKKEGIQNGDRITFSLEPQT